MSVLNLSFPDVLKVARVTPLFKAGDKFICNNYRPISLQSHIKQVFEREVHARISSLPEKYNILSNFRLVFRTAHSTQHGKNYLHRNGPLLFVYINVLPRASAFQTVLLAEDTCFFFKSRLVSNKFDLKLQ